MTKGLHYSIHLEKLVVARGAWHGGHGFGREEAGHCRPVRRWRRRSLEEERDDHLGGEDEELKTGPAEGGGRQETPSPRSSSL